MCIFLNICWQHCLEKSANLASVLRSLFHVGEVHFLLLETRLFRATEDSTMKSAIFALLLAVPAVMGYEVTELTDDSFNAEMEAMDTALGKTAKTSIFLVLMHCQMT